MTTEEATQARELAKRLREHAKGLPEAKRSPFISYAERKEAEAARLERLAGKDAR